MKRKVILSILLFCLMAIKGYSQTGFVINAKIIGLPDGRKVYLRGEDKEDHFAGEILDSTQIKKGKIQFKGHVDFPQCYNLVIEKQSDQRFSSVIPVFIENNKINISAELDEKMTELEALLLNRGYSYNNVNVTGSESHDLYLKFVRRYEPLNKQSEDAFEAYINYLNPGKGKKRGRISEGIKLLGPIDSAKAVVRNYIGEFIRQNNSNPVSLYILKKYKTSLTGSGLSEYLATLSPELRSSDLASSLAEKAEVLKKSDVGANFVDFAFNDKDGNPVKLSDHVGKGKYTLLDFWASWCNPCRADIPHLKEVYELYHPEGFEIISISMDDNKDKWLKAVAEEKMSWLQVSDLKSFTGELSKIYNFTGIPTCILIGPDGKIVTRYMRGLWMDKTLIELYGNKFGDKF